MSKMNKNKFKKVKKDTKRYSDDDDNSVII